MPKDEINRITGAVRRNLRYTDWSIRIARSAAPIIAAGSAMYMGQPICATKIRAK